MIDDGCDGYNISITIRKWEVEGSEGIFFRFAFTPLGSTGRPSGSILPIPQIESQSDRPKVNRYNVCIYGNITHFIKN